MHWYVLDNSRKMQRIQACCAQGQALYFLIKIIKLGSTGGCRQEKNSYEEKGWDSYSPIQLAQLPICKKMSGYQLDLIHVFLYLSIVRIKVAERVFILYQFTLTYWHQTVFFFACCTSGTIKGIFSVPLVCIIFIYALHL